MEADTLGIFAQNGVYAANLFTMDAQYQLAAINLYTNYDGSGSGFGDTLVSCTTDDIETSTAYAAINGDNEDVITLVVTNKAFDDKTTANIELGNEYKYAHLYGINSMSSQLFDMTDSNPAVTLNGSSLTLEMEPRTVSLLVIAKDKEALDTREAVSSAAEREREKQSPAYLGDSRRGSGSCGSYSVCCIQDKEKSTLIAGSRKRPESVFEGSFGRFSVIKRPVLPGT